MYACASNIFAAKIPIARFLGALERGGAHIKGELSSRLTSFMKLVGITFLILQKGGEVNINSLNKCLKSNF
jgi:hypothetical protein